MAPRLSGPLVVASQSAGYLKVPKDRAHLTHTSDTSCMIEGDSDDKRKTRFHLILGSRKTLLSTMPRDVGLVAYTTGQPYRSHPSDSHE